MHLKKHTRLELPFADFPMNASHGDFDHVSGGALDGSVDCIALSGSADSCIRRTNITEIAAATGDRLNISALASEFDRIRHVAPDQRELREIMVNDLHGFAARNAQALRQPESRHSIGKSVIYHFGFATHIFCYQV